MKNLGSIDVEGRKVDLASFRQRLRVELYKRFSQSVSDRIVEDKARTIGSEFAKLTMIITLSEASYTKHINLIVLKIIK